MENPKEVKLFGYFRLYSLAYDKKQIVAINVCNVTSECESCRFRSEAEPRSTHLLYFVAKRDDAKTNSINIILGANGA